MDRGIYDGVHAPGAAVMRTTRTFWPARTKTWPTAMMSMASGRPITQTPGRVVAQYLDRVEDDHFALDRTHADLAGIVQHQQRRREPMRPVGRRAAG